LGEPNTVEFESLVARQSSVSSYVSRWIEQCSGK
jgi:hypothetical protein